MLVYRAVQADRGHFASSESAGHSASSAVRGPYRLLDAGHHLSSLELEYSAPLFGSLSVQSLVHYCALSLEAYGRGRCV